jgi:hypothetical protein
MAIAGNTADTTGPEQLYARRAPIRWFALQVAIYDAQIPADQLGARPPASSELAGDGLPPILEVIQKEIVAV